MRAVAGDVDKPLVDECSFYASDWCGPDFETYSDPADPDADYDIHWDELDTVCPTQKTTTTIVQPPPTHSPMAHPHPSQNKLTCFKSGVGATHYAMDQGNGRACSDLKAIAEWWGDRPMDTEYNYKKTFYVYPYESRKRQSDQPTSPSDYAITYAFTLLKKCDWLYNEDDCLAYLKLPVDACNCEGVDNKQGGTMWNDCIRVTIDANREGGGGSPFDPN